jgi:hypothetical protein
MPFKREKHFSRKQSPCQADIVLEHTVIQVNCLVDTKRIPRAVLLPVLLTVRLGWLGGC